jgi:DNA-binding protein HU-beta
MAGTRGNEADGGKLIEFVKCVDNLNTIQKTLSNKAFLRVCPPHYSKKAQKRPENPLKPGFLRIFILAKDKLSVMNRSYRRANVILGMPHLQAFSMHFERRCANKRSECHNMAKVTQPTVTLKNIAAEIAEKHELSKKQLNLIMEDLVASLVKNLKKGNRVRMAGLGILQVRKRAARMGRNPATGETIKIPAKKKIAFRAAKELKEAVGK